MKAIDLFAGLGGFSEGAQMAGVDVVWAANHWPSAVAIHAANHPAAEHACQDLHQDGIGFSKACKLPAQHRLAVQMIGNAVAPPAACAVILAMLAAV
jgi:site-specific DNA-cytosine methylase